MLDNFWDSILSTDPLEMDYVHSLSYESEETLDEVKQKLDWMVLKLHRLRNERQFDYELVDQIRKLVATGEYSLTTNGVDYLNIVVSSFKETDL